MNVSKCVWLLLCLFLLVAKLQAQQTPASLEGKIKLPASRLSMPDISSLVYKQAGYRFSFNAAQTGFSSVQHFSRKEYTLRELLELIKKNTGAAYTVYQSHIIFRKNAPVGTAYANASPPGENGNGKTGNRHDAPAGGKHKAAGNNEANGKGAARPIPPAHAKTKESRAPKGSAGSATVAAKGHVALNGKNGEGNKPAGVSDNNDGASLVPQNHAAAGAVKNTPPVNVSAHEGKGNTLPAFTVQSLSTRLNNSEPAAKQRLAFAALSAPAPALAARRIRERSGFPWLVQAGLAGDETFYAQPTVMAGLQYVYGMASWSTNFNTGGFRFGLGGSLPLRNDWFIHAQATTGKLSGKGTNLDSNRLVMAKSSLHRITLLVEKQLNDRWSVAAGPVFNYLITDQYRNGEKGSMAAFGLQDRFPDGIHTIKPPYTLSNSYKPGEASFTQTWIGFQAGIFYRIKK